MQFVDRFVGELQTGCATLGQADLVELIEYKMHRGKWRPSLLKWARQNTDADVRLQLAKGCELFDSDDEETPIAEWRMDDDSSTASDSSDDDDFDFDEYFFANYGYQFRTSPGGGNLYQEYYGKDTTYLIQTRERERQGHSHNVQLGMDWFINPRNTLTGSFLFG